MLLQRDIIRVECHKFLRHIRSLAPPSVTGTIEAFISYVWGTSNRQELQARLLDIVDDLSNANIEVLLDIMQLHPGSDVKRFMEDKIKSSNTVLWIGTPDLKSRITFTDDGKPSTNAAIEFCHIRDKDAAISGGTLTSPHWSIQALWFYGKTPSDAFPDKHGLNSVPHDFTRARDYYIRLPLLVASIFGILNSSPFDQEYEAYLQTIKQYEVGFSTSSIESRLQEEKSQASKKRHETELRIESLINNMPDSYLQQQRQTHDAQKQALLSRLSQIKHDSLSPDTPHAQALEYYVPLKGGPHPDSEPPQYFDAITNISYFIESDTSSSSVIFGAAGSGKSLFARFLERNLWDQWQGKEVNEVVPIFISLPYFSSSITSPADDKCPLIDHVLQNLGFALSDIESLRSTFRFLFVLDGLDEVSLDVLPKESFLLRSGLSNWLNTGRSNKVIALCRTQQISILEDKLDTSILRYFADPAPATPSLVVNNFYLMPFDGSQISQFLSGYSQSMESRLYANWSPTAYEQQIQNISGLSALVQNPFLLKLIVKILPNLSNTPKV